MAGPPLRDKHRRVLTLIVEDYVRHGRPVSSKAIIETGRFEGSPATVRNIMARLETLGYLSQPHTSAGRVPTDKGLRSYVDHLLAEAFYFPENVHLFQEGFSASGSDMDSLLLEASRILADYSDNLGFVISPHISRVFLDHIRFVRISDKKIMAILVTPFQMVLTETLETAHPFNQLDLDRASQYINKNFRGKNLLSVRDFLLKELPKVRTKYEDTVNKLIDIVRAYTAFEGGEERIFIQGSSRLLNKAELFDMAKLRSLFRNFEQKAGLVKLLSEFISLDKVKVLIGSEVNFPDVADCSLILSHYGTRNQVLGSLGIIGPKRIPYEKIIPLVDRVAKRLSRAITSPGREVPS
jgi:heat-inducible transcriptional repressor